MTFPELREALLKISSQEVSAAVDYYLEAVVNKGRFDDLTALLNNYFGVPLKPAGAASTEEMNRIAGRYGGVRDQQILYAVKREKVNDIALVWPWARGERFTVKLIREAALFKK